MIYYGKTDRGIVRSENQDTFGVEEIKLKCTDSCSLLAVVCDGMGGAAAGSVASKTACESFMGYVVRQIEAYDEDLSNPANIPFEKILRDGVKIANKSVLATAAQSPDYRGMGTTLVGILTVGGKLYAVNIGDSRLYAQSSGVLSQVSHDHSFVQSLVDNGSITAEQARNHPEKNVILKAIGASANAEADTFVLEKLPDAVILCSDGLSNMVSDEDISRALSSDTELSAAIDDLVNKANAQGGSDNITAFAVRF